MSILGGERGRSDGAAVTRRGSSEGDARVFGGGSSTRASVGAGAETGPEAAFGGRQRAVTRALAAGEVTERVWVQLAGGEEARRGGGGGDGGQGSRRGCRGI